MIQKRKQAPLFKVKWGKCQSKHRHKNLDI